MHAIEMGLGLVADVKLRATGVAAGVAVFEGVGEAAFTMSAAEGLSCGGGEGSVSGVGVSVVMATDS